MEPCQCITGIFDNQDDYSDPNYEQIGRSVQYGHLVCLKMLHFMGKDWHNDIAVVAIENVQVECLKYIIENMGRVDTKEKLLQTENISSKCVEYLMSDIIINLLNYDDKEEEDEDGIPVEES
jgi:hypothetical protein